MALPSSCLGESWPLRGRFKAAVLGEAVDVRLGPNPGTTGPRPLGLRAVTFEHMLGEGFHKREVALLPYSIIETCIGCTACTKRCPTNAITGERNQLHVIDPTLCIDCGACGLVCPPEAIMDTFGEMCRSLKKNEWPKAVVIEDKCIGSGCELCINICPFDALSLQHTGRIDDFFGVSVVDEKKCTGCRLCEDVCGWDAVHIFPLKDEILKPWEALSGEEQVLVVQARKARTV